MGSRRTLALIAVVLAAAAPAVAARVGGSPTLFDLRVCGRVAYSTTRLSCTRDVRASVLISDRFNCSIELAARSRGRLIARMTYNGKTVNNFTTRMLGRGGYRYAISEGVGPGALAGGPWACFFSFGAARVSARFTSGGPAGAAINLAACDAAHAVVTGGVRACSSHERTIATPTAIACNAVLPDAAGRMSSIELLTGGKVVAASSASAVPRPMWLQAVAFSSGAVAFAPGTYVCRFSIGGVVSAARSFRVT